MMNNTSTPTNFTELFINNLDSKLNITEKKSEAHAFFFLEDFINNLNSLPANFEFKEFWKYKSKLESAINNSIKLFELETSLLIKNKGLYIDRTFENLKIIDYALTSARQRIKEDSYFKLHTRNVNIYHVLGMLKDCLVEIYFNLENKYSTFLNKTNRDYLQFIMKPEKFYKSFSLLQNIEKRRFEKIFNRIKPFLSRDTSFETFKTHFENTYPQKKIIWIGTKSALCYFIQNLISNKIIVDPKNKHWKIVSQNFLLKGEYVSSAKLLNQKLPSTKDKFLINSIIESMKF